MMLMVMVAIGLAVLSQVDTQTTQSRKERERESSFNLAEAALSAQTFVLGRRGTGTATHSLPDELLHRREQRLLLPGERSAHAELTPAFRPGRLRRRRPTGRTWVRDDANPTTGAPVLFWDDAYLGNGSWARYDRGGAFGPGGTIDPEPPRLGARGGHRARQDACPDRVCADRGQARELPAVRGACGLRARAEQRQQDARELDRKPTWPRRALRPAPAVRHLHRPESRPRARSWCRPTTSS